MEVPRYATFSTNRLIYYIAINKTIKIWTKELEFIAIAKNNKRNL